MRSTPFLYENLPTVKITSHSTWIPTKYGIGMHMYISSQTLLHFNKGKLRQPPPPTPPKKKTTSKKIKKYYDKAKTVDTLATIN